MDTRVVFNLDWDRGEPYKESTVDPMHLWHTTDISKKRGWLKQHGLREEHAEKFWDDLPRYVQERWESESEV